MNFRSSLCAALVAFGPLLAGVGAASAQTMPTCASGDPVVWENTSTKVYHAEGDPYYGKTKHGAYVCQSAADKAGYHAAKAKATSSKSSATSGTTKDAAIPGAAPAASAPAASAMASPSGRHRKHRSKGAASPAPMTSPAPAAT